MRLRLRRVVRVRVVARLLVMVRDGSAVRDVGASLLRVLLRVLLLHELLGVGVFALGAGVHQTARALFLGISLGLALNVWSEASEANARGAMTEDAAAPEAAPEAATAAPPAAEGPWRRFAGRLRRQALAQRAVAQIAANFENESDGEDEGGEEDAEYAALFAQQPQLSIVAFNIRKLQANIEGTAPMFQALMKEMSEHDVIMLTEVPASDRAYRERVLWFLSALNTLSKSTCVLSKRRSRSSATGRGRPRRIRASRAAWTGRRSRWRSTSRTLGRCPRRRCS